MSIESNVPGGWTEYSTKIDQETAKIFKEATGNLLGMNYTALTVATQVVAGLNYSFFCNSNRPGSGFNQAAMVLVYVNLAGDVFLQSITPVHR